MEYAQLIESQGWVRLEGAALSKANSLLGPDSDPEMWAKKFGRKTVFLRYTGVVRMYAIDDQGQPHMDKFYRLDNLDQAAREVLARTYGQVTPRGKLDPGPRHILRASVIRLAAVRPDMRPHLLSILASSTDLMSLLRNTFQDGFLYEVEGEPKFKTIRKGKGQFNGTWFVDKWSWRSDSHYTEDGGAYYDYTFPDRVQVEFVIVLKDIPPGSEERDIELVVPNLIESYGKAAFQDDIDNDGPFRMFLDDSLDTSSGTLSGMGWNVKQIDVRSVNATIRRGSDEAAIKVVVELDVDTDEDGVTVEPDEPDYDDRYGSLRKEIIRLAHVYPEFRKDLLPLVVK